MTTLRQTATPVDVPWWRQTYALLSKDLKAELRTKVAVSAVGVFTFASLLLLGLATAALKEVHTIKILRLPEPMMRADLIANQLPAWDSPSKMGLLWVLFCFAAFAGLAHSFVHEEETGTVTALRLSMSAEAVYTGKLLFNLIVLFVIMMVITPIYMAMTGMSIGSPFVFLAVMLSGGIGLASTATIIGALAAKAQGTGALYGALGLPLLLVFLMLLMNAAMTVFEVNAPTLRVVKDVGGLFSFGVLIISMSVMLFHFIWEE
ncbi:MAG: ABC-type transport system involved in cytochrome c biosis, permease component [Chthonomonadaceae bacterium]|nr:ABC-type transport system involved in cytochrome c biosis, permease component [Chthonomonadaceae bacterium]